MLGDKKGGEIQYICINIIISITDIEQLPQLQGNNSSDVITNYIIITL